MPKPPILFETSRFRVESCTDSGDSERPPKCVIRHPGAAVILPLLPDGRVVLIRNRRIAIEAELLELPAGTLEPPETPLACAQRELTEETGYRADELTPLISFYSSPGFCDERLHAFVARDLTAGRQHLDPAERITVVPLEWAAVLREIETGGIIDGKTIVTLLYYDRYTRTAG